MEFVSLPPPRPSPTGEGAGLRHILLTAAVLHMDSYETVAIFAANEFPPLWGTGTAHPQDEKVRVEAADNSPAGLGFCRVAVQVIVWKKVYFVLDAVATRFSTPLPAPASQGRETNCKHAQGITEKENGHLRGRFAVFPSAEAGGCCGLFVVVVLAVDVAAVITLEGVAAAAFGCTEDTTPIVGAVGVTIFVSIFDGVE